MPLLIEFNIAADVQDTIARILNEARRAGVQLEGDDREGTFAGLQARGSYQINGQRLSITVTEKPWLVPETLIRNVARSKAPDWGLELA